MSTNKKLLILIIILSVIIVILGMVSSSIDAYNDVIVVISSVCANALVALSITLIVRLIVSSSRKRKEQKHSQIKAIEDAKEITNEIKYYIEKRSNSLFYVEEYNFDPNTEPLDGLKVILEKIKEEDPVNILELAHLYISVSFIHDAYLLIKHAIETKLFKNEELEYKNYSFVNKVDENINDEKMLYGVVTKYLKVQSFKPIRSFCDITSEFKENQSKSDLKNKVNSSRKRSLWGGFVKSWHITPKGVMTRYDYFGALLFHSLFCLTGIYIYVAWLPLIFCYIRRLHDANLSGFLCLIPGAIAVLQFFPSVRPNDYV